MAAALSGTQKNLISQAVCAKLFVLLEIQQYLNVWFIFTPFAPMFRTLESVQKC